jgi:hypothetical protein
MFPICRHQGNANQNYIEILPLQSQRLSFRKQESTNPGKFVGEKESLYTADGNVNLCSYHVN